MRGGQRSRLQLVVLELDAERADLLCERPPRVRRVVGDEAQLVAGLTQPRDRLRAAQDRMSRDMEHAVDIEENSTHRARGVYGRPGAGSIRRATRPEPQRIARTAICRPTPTYGSPSRERPSIRVRASTRTT